MVLAHHHLAVGLRPIRVGSTSERWWTGLTKPALSISAVAFDALES
jgi:hypothetical protein